MDGTSMPNPSKVNAQAILELTTVIEKMKSDLEETKSELLAAEKAIANFSKHQVKLTQKNKPASDTFAWNVIEDDSI